MEWSAVPDDRFDGHSHEAARRGYRRERYALRAVAAEVLGTDRLAACGVRPIGSGPVGVALVHGEHGSRAVFHNLQTCGLVWVCPVCAAKICEGRRAELECILGRHVAAGGSVYMAALTVPHHAFQTCRQLRGAVTAIFRKVVAGQPWLRAKAAAGVEGFVRSLEVTYGEHGWHPHLHLLFFLDSSANDDQAQAFGRWLFERWARFVERAGLGCCNPSIWRFERVESVAQAGDYITKWGAAAELTKAHTKRARSGGRTPWDILYDIQAHNRDADRELFREYAQAFHGARQLTWSVGLRTRYAAGPELSDTDLAVQASDAADVLGAIPQAAWSRVVQLRMQALILDHAERDGWPAVEGLLNMAGIDLHTADPPGFL